MTCPIRMVVTDVTSSLDLQRDLSLVFLGTATDSLVISPVDWGSGRESKMTMNLIHSGVQIIESDTDNMRVTSQARLVGASPISL